MPAIVEGRLARIGAVAFTRAIASFKMCAQRTLPQSFRIGMRTPAFGKPRGDEERSFACAIEIYRANCRSFRGREVANRFEFECTGDVLRRIDCRFGDRDRARAREWYWVRRRTRSRSRERGHRWREM